MESFAELSSNQVCIFSAHAHAGKKRRRERKNIQGNWLPIKSAAKSGYLYFFVFSLSSSSGRHTGLHSDTKEEKEEKKTKMEFENTRKEWERESWLNIDVTSQALSIKRNSFHQTESKYTASIRPEEDEEREEEKTFRTRRERSERKFQRLLTYPWYKLFSLMFTTLKKTVRFFPLFPSTCMYTHLPSKFGWFRLGLKWKSTERLALRYF